MIPGRLGKKRVRKLVKELIVSLSAYFLVSENYLLCKMRGVGASVPF